MKVLLTGSNGMVGRNILEHESAGDYDFLTPSSSALDLLDEAAVRAFLERETPDLIIHSAGIVGGIQANIANPVKFLVGNTMMGLNLVNAAYELGVPNVLNLGSSCMFPRAGQNPLREDAILTGELEPTNEGYALAKISTMRLCEYVMREAGGLNYKTLIPCNLYGRHDNFDPVKSHMIPSAIRKVATARRDAESGVEIWGDGTARREFMYAGDLADFIFYAIPRLDGMPQNLNVGLGTDFTINEYYEAIAGVVGYQGGFRHDLTKPVGMKQKLVDVTRLRDFGWTHKVSLEEGIARTLEFMQAEQTV